MNELTINFRELYRNPALRSVAIELTRLVDVSDFIQDRDREQFVETEPLPVTPDTNGMATVNLATNSQFLKELAYRITVYEIEAYFIMPDESKTLSEIFNTRSRGL